MSFSSVSFCLLCWLAPLFCHFAYLFFFFFFTRSVLVKPLLPDSIPRSSYYFIALLLKAKKKKAFLKNLHRINGAEDASTEESTTHEETEKTSGKEEKGSGKEEKKSDPMDDGEFNWRLSYVVNSGEGGGGDEYSPGDKKCLCVLFFCACLSLSQWWCPHNAMDPSTWFERRQQHGLARWNVVCLTLKHVEPADSTFTPVVYLEFYWFENECDLMLVGFIILIVLLNFLRFKFSWESTGLSRNVRFCCVHFFAGCRCSWSFNEFLILIFPHSFQFWQMQK